VGYLVFNLMQGPTCFIREIIVEDENDNVIFDSLLREVIKRTYRTGCKAAVILVSEFPKLSGLEKLFKTVDFRKQVDSSFQSFGLLLPDYFLERCRDSYMVCVLDFPRFMRYAQSRKISANRTKSDWSFLMDVGSGLVTINQSGIFTTPNLSGPSQSKIDVDCSISRPDFMSLLFGTKSISQIMEQRGITFHVEHPSKDLILSILSKTFHLNSWWLWPSDNW
jgi:hypothetical protein